MIVEYIRYAIPPSDTEVFERAYAAASVALDESEHCLGYELARGVEEPGNWILRIEWDSVEGHEQGFRRSPGFGAFFQAVRPFLERIEEMRHYEPTAVRAGAAAAR